VHFSRGKILFALILLLVVGFFLWTHRSWTYENLPPRATGPWVAFGDSLTEGFGASPGADYPAQLSRHLGIPIQNLGVSGETSADGLRRVPAVEALEPRVVLLCFGGNDVLQNLRRDEMISNVGAIIDRLHARGSFVLLIGIRGASLVGDRNAGAFKSLAREKHVLFVSDILEGLLANPAMMSDQIHPNDAGYAAIADRVEHAIHPVLPQLR